MAFKSVDALKKNLIELGILSEDSWAQAMPSIFSDDPSAVLHALNACPAFWPSGTDGTFKVVEDYQLSEILAGRGVDLRVNEFVILSKIDAGGQGHLFLCRDTNLDQLRALKFLSSTSPTEEERLRLEREAKLLAKLWNGEDGERIREYIPTVFGTGSHPNRGTYCVLEYVRGESLQTKIRRAHLRGVKLEVHDVLDWIYTVTKVLVVAHAKGIIHRDIKPGNIMLSDSHRIKLLDLGLARLLSVSNTSCGFAFGTPQYMPPEQWNDASSVDATGDIYSLGATLYCLLTGSTPFHGNLDELREAHRNKEPIAASTLRSDVPPKVDALITAMMQKTPSDRMFLQDVMANLIDLKKMLTEDLQEREGWQRLGVAKTKRSKKKPKIGFIGCGGTMAVRRDSNGNTLPPDLPAEQILSYAKDVWRVAEISTVDPMCKDSTDIGAEDWDELAETLIQNSDCEGFVITHGTDTLAYTACAMSLVFGKQLQVPIVFTGAHMPISDFASDGMFNLQNAFRTCLAAIDRDVAEVMVVFGHSALRGCRVRKRSDFEFDAFDSPCFEPLATFGYDIVFSPQVRKKNGIANSPIHIAFKNGVHHLRLTPGINPSQIQSLFNDTASPGVILESFGTGMIPARMIPIIKNAKIPVVITRSFVQTQNRVDERTESELLDAGAVLVNDMTSEMAAVKLMWLAAQELDAATVRTMMARNLVGEISGPLQ